MKKVFIHEETEIKVVAINEVQAAALKNEGFKEVTEKKK